MKNGIRDVVGGKVDGIKSRTVYFIKIDQREVGTRRRRVRGAPPN